MKYKLETVFDFGKYKGKTTKEIINEDINYIVWCLIQIDDFYFDDCAITEFIDNKHNIYLNHSRFNDHRAILIALEFKEGDYEKEFNRQVSEILSKKGIKK
jgi:hypothetical protein